MRLGVRRAPSERQAASGKKAFPMTTAIARLEERLERGEIVLFEPCPFELPGGADRAFSDAAAAQKLGTQKHQL